MRARKQAFTLIELLVVVAIIMLLAALLLPALRTARSRARTIQCVGNVKQQALAALMYTTDANDVLPLYWENANFYAAGLSRLIEGRVLPVEGTLSVTWFGTTYNPRRCGVLICPAEPLPALSATAGSAPRLEYENANATFRNGYAGIINTSCGADPRQAAFGWAPLPLYTNYGLNGTYPSYTSPYLLPCATDVAGDLPHHITEATFPADTWLSADNSWADVGLREVVFPHLAASRNYSYLDGHAENLRVGQVDGAFWAGYHQVWDDRATMIR